MGFISWIFGVENIDLIDKNIVLKREVKRLSANEYGLKKQIREFQGEKKSFDFDRDMHVEMYIRERDYKIEIDNKFNEKLNPEVFKSSFCFENDACVFNGNPFEFGFNNIYEKDGLLFGDFGATTYGLNYEGKRITAGYHYICTKTGVGKLGSSSDYVYDVDAVRYKHRIPIRDILGKNVNLKLV